MLALDIKAKRVILANLDLRDPPALQDRQQSMYLPVTAQLFLKFKDPEDHLDHQAPKDNQERMESRYADGFTVNTLSF